MEASYRFYTNRDCKYFPCHPAPPEDRFNCLFCYCPLYPLGERCGGHFYYNEKGNKVCTDCSFPHHPESYDKIIGRYPELSALAARKEAAEGEGR